MKITHPSGIAVVVLVAILSAATTLVVQARTQNGGGNPNPAIEWVLIQASPKIPGNAGISITIQGYNFTSTNNEVRVKNSALKSNLPATDGMAINDPNSPGSQRFSGMKPQIIKFELPEGVPCATGETCPLRIINANGTSNTVSFSL